MASLTSAMVSLLLRLNPHVLRYWLEKVRRLGLSGLSTRGSSGFHTFIPPGQGGMTRG